jgi:hypothetical protein
VYKNKNYVRLNCVTLFCVEEMHELERLLPKFGILGGAVKTATKRTMNCGSIPDWSKTSLFFSSPNRPNRATVPNSHYSMETVGSFRGVKPPALKLTITSILFQGQELVELFLHSPQSFIKCKGELNLHHFITTVSRDSAVDIATCSELDGPGTESRWGRDFVHPSRPTLRFTQPPTQWVQGHCRE